MVTVATFNDAAEAKRLKERLQQAGLRADMINEGHIQQVAFMSKPQANVKVKVDDNEFEKARSLMVGWESTNPEIASAMIRCPQCNSSQIEYPQMTRKFLTPALASVLFTLKIFPKEFYCENCHFTWSNESQGGLFRLWHRFFPGKEGA